MNRYQQGLNGEAQAEKYLTQQGMTCLHRRWRGGQGEIDLVMLDGDTLVFVEVKARPKASYGSGLMAVTPDKQRRMFSAAEAYLLTAEEDHACRFDVVELTLDGIRHVADAFRP